MRLAITLLVISKPGVTVYVCTGEFSPHTVTEADIKEVVDKLTFKE